MKRIAKVILFKGDKVLLHLRDNKKDTAYPNTWSLIGGHLEDEESAEDGIKREVKEEIALDLEKVDLISSKIKKEKEIIFEENIFAASLLHDISQLKLKEGKKIKLFSVDKLDSINIRPVFKDAILNFLSAKD